MVVLHTCEGKVRITYIVVLAIAIFFVNVFIFTMASFFLFLFHVLFVHFKLVVLRRE